MSTPRYVIETVSWKAKEDVTNKAMIQSVESMLVDLKDLPGFIHETLSLSEEGNWLQLYYWESAEDAHNSNHLMAEKSSLANLMMLIEPESIAIEVLTPQHVSSELALFS
ncbi:hypothetical protein [Vibrio penaeicida]|uniref:hypothetical protein n=1 Tax=Vibrio penaeicida TaxID=104609 RepID=UPI000CE9E35D|nr:hypothetical protein [Vibrio penaeicida]